MSREDSVAKRENFISLTAAYMNPDQQRKWGGLTSDRLGYSA